MQNQKGRRLNKLEGAYGVVDKSISTCQGPCATVVINHGRSMQTRIIQNDIAIHVENLHKSLMLDRCVEIATIDGRVELSESLAHLVVRPQMSPRS